jgi:plastocyanin
MFWFLIPFSFAKVYNINVGENNALSFTNVPKSVNVGDTIVWTWLNNKLHSVLEGTDCRPKDDGFYSGEKSDGTFALIIGSKDIGMVNFYCGVSSHCLQGMSGMFSVVSLNSTVSTVSTKISSDKNLNFINLIYLIFV